MKPNIFWASLFIWCAPVLAQTQTEMNESACGQLNAADKTLNETYRNILREHGKDKVFVAKLRDAQRAWVKYRNAHLSSVWPENDKPLMYGSVYPMCNCDEALELTTERIAHLEKWISPDGEGDACAGSRR